MTVVIKGSMLGVATDAEGRFEIVSPEDKTLVFTYVGRKTQEVAFDAGTTDIKVVMPVEDVELNPLVAADVESILNQAADSTKDEVVSVWQDEFFKVVEDKKMKSLAFGKTNFLRWWRICLNLPMVIFLIILPSMCVILRRQRKTV